MQNDRHHLAAVKQIFSFIVGLFLLVSGSSMASVDGEYGNYPVVDTASSTRVNDLIQQVIKQRVIYVGESHSSVEDHMLQYEVLKAMTSAGQPFAIGVEWFQQPFQSVLDDYIAGKLDEKEMLHKAEYYKRWGFDYRLYRPIMRHARKHGIRILALNARRELTDKIMKAGLEAAHENFHEELPADYDFTESGYTRLLQSMFGDPDDSSHAMDGGFKRFLEVQLTWDEAMAERASEFLASNEDSSLIVFAGRGHTHAGAIPARVTRRTGIKGVSLLNFQANTPFNSADYLVLAEEQQLPPQAIIGVMIKEQDDAVLVTGFSQASHAEPAGIKKNDRILAVDDEVVNSLVDLKMALIERLPGEDVSLLLLREQDSKEESLKVSVKLMQRN